MSQGQYELRHEALNPKNIAGQFVVDSETGRMLAGVGHNPHRAWVSPLNTPRGLNVVQEYPFDHPFHNGVFVGQSMVTVGGRTAHFWAPGPDWRNPDNYIYSNIGLLRYGREAPASIEPRDGGFRFTYQNVWCDEHERPMLDEERTIDIYAADGGTICDLFTTKTAAYGAVHYAATKHGTIGVRVQPQLLPFMGGQIIGGENEAWRRGDEVAAGRPSGFVAYEADVPGLGPFGVCLTVLENTASSNRQGPWFIRNYGMAMFNATMEEPVHTPEGEAWSAGLRVVAYDGALDPERLHHWGERPSW